MYKQWFLTDLKNVPENGYNVMSTFSCGGGSSMGYKLSGFKIKAINDIDPELIGVYKANFEVPYVFHEDIRKLVEREDIPQELYGIDVLDGSPPCSLFSMAGIREEGWSKEKVFREGQAKQTLDDLFFVFIRLAEKLKPKIVISENVKGMLQGNAKGYVKKVVEEFSKIGYDTQIFLLNSATMGVPQRRERVFFMSRRRELALPPIKLEFHEPQILYCDIKTIDGIHGSLTPSIKELLKYKSYHDNNIADINIRVHGRNSQFNAVLLKDYKVPNTIASSSTFVSYTDERLLTSTELLRIQSFPEDYNFGSRKYDAIKYILGMSVPPYMMNRISKQVQLQWLDPLKNRA